MKIINKRISMLLVIIALSIVVFVSVKNNDSREYYAVEKKDMDLILETRGYVESEGVAELHFEVVEKVTNVLVAEGDVVKKGDVLATISTASLAQSSQIAKDNRDIARFEKELFIENYSSNMDAVGGEDEYRLQLRSLDENISKATAQYNQALINNRKSVIEAPFDSTVSKVYVNEGDLSSISSPAIEIQNISKPVLYANIAEVDIAYVDENDEVEIIFDAFPNKIFAGKIFRVNSIAETIQGIAYYKAEINPDKLPDKLRMGMNADINILAETRYDVVYVPLYLVTDVTTNSGKVELVTHGDVIETEVKIGLNNYQGVEIITGLKEGDTVTYDE